jgi:hypothetical protein
MKINLELDTTPQELRAFFGLPDIEPLQRQWMDQVREQIRKGIDQFDPATLMTLNPMLAQQMKLFEGMQKTFWDAFSKAPK